MNSICRNMMMSLMFGSAGLICAYPGARDGFRVEILVDGVGVPEYRLDGTAYIEALKGREYAIRLTNPLPVRAAVALSVDGLNTIDAKHTDASSASKWVLAPYETITIQGWQTGSGHARRFFFTTEDDSYGTWLGKTKNLGVISAVFYREKTPPIESQAIGRDGREMSAAAPSAAQKDALREKAANEEYAATGIGSRYRHQVERVHLELESQPCSSFSIRYEFRPVLARLGILPYPKPVPDPMERRRRAHGFDGMSFCPEPQ